MSDLRTTILAEQQIVAAKRRFALFSQPPPLAIGDDGAYQAKQPKKGENGKPITKPPQLLAGPCRTGMVKSAYFNVPQSILQKDPYKQTYKRQIQYQRKMHTRSTFHQNQFKPASAYKTLDKASYRYKEQNPETKKKIIRDQTGKVRTQPRNFTTNPISKVETEFFKPLKHMTDEYDRPKELANKERKVFKSKLPEATYKTMSHGNKAFTKDSIIYGQDAKTSQMAKQKNPRAKTSMNIFPHEAAFKPARRGHGDPLGKFPQFIDKKTEQTMSPKKRQNKQEKKQTFKPNNFGLTRPTPSIAYHPTNIGLSKLK